MSWIDSGVKELLRRNGIDYLPRLVRVEFLGQMYFVRNGVVDDGDYDDAWMLALAHNSQNIFDIGSNIGQSAFNMLHAPNVENVVLVDPSSFALTIAADTLIRNQMGHRIRFVNAFVSDKSGKEVSFTAGYTTGGHIVTDTGGEKAAEAKVPTISIDDIVEKTGLVPDFIKLDVEGYEEKALIGCAKLASKNRTRFMTEMHSTNRTQEEATETVLKWCVGNAYAAWYLKEATRLTTAETVKHRGRYHLLLQPESWDYPKWLSKIPQNAPVEAVFDALQ